MREENVVHVNLDGGLKFQNAFLRGPTTGEELHW